MLFACTCASSKYTFRQLRIDFKKINNHKQNSDLTRSHRRVGRWHFKFRPCNQRLSWHIHHHATKAREVHLDSLYAVDGLKTAYEEQYEARYPSTWLLDQRVALLKVAWSRLWDPFKWAWVHIHHPSTSFFVARGLWHRKTVKRWQWSCPKNQVACERTSQHTIQRLGIRRDADDVERACTTTKRCRRRR